MKITTTLNRHNDIDWNAGNYDDTKDELILIDWNADVVADRNSIGIKISVDKITMSRKGIVWSDDGTNDTQAVDEIAATEDTGWSIGVSIEPRGKTANLLELYPIHITVDSEAKDAKIVFSNLSNNDDLPF
jgi:hypothetical protein